MSCKDRCGWDGGAGRQEGFIWMRGLGLTPVLSSFYPDCLPCIQLPQGEPEPHPIADALTCIPQVNLEAASVSGPGLLQL